MKYFTIAELTHSNEAQDNRIDNTPSKGVIENLTELAENVLDVARERLDKPIRVNCGYRCKELNDKVGGANNSQHLTGEAADIEGENNLQLARVVFENCIFDQLILEYPDKAGVPAWVHVSFSQARNRRQVLTCKRVGGVARYYHYTFNK
jgi:zinc D-Ala-D-Ala carboxypeptidase